MKDNGLLQYYRQKANKQGFLKLDALPFEKHPVTTLKHKMDGRDFYIKKCLPFVCSAEVLLSQIYDAAGIKTAIYLPGVVGREYAVVSNSVESANSVKAMEFFSNIKTKDAIVARTYNTTNKPDSIIDCSKHFTPQSMRELILTQALDVATFNTDRHFNNFFAEVNDPFDIFRAEHFVSFDYGACLRASETDPRLINFYSTFGSGNQLFDRYPLLKSKDEIVDILRDDEILNSYMPRQEIAETLGSISAKDIAVDIFEQTGFAPDKYFVNRVDKSLYQTAEQLGQ